MVNINKYLRILFFLIVKLFVLFLIGINVRKNNPLPQKGPAIIVANHNSHLDSLVLMSLFPLNLINDIHPVAAADYFLKGKVFSCFSKNIIGIIPIIRGKASKGYDPIELFVEALDKGKIIIIFPEGSRGDPEQKQNFKKGIAHLAERKPNVPIYPIFLYGLGKALPKGDPLFIPFFCDLFIGNVLYFHENKDKFMQNLNITFDTITEDINLNDFI